MKWIRRSDYDGDFYTAAVLLGGKVALEIIVSREHSKPWGASVTAASGESLREIENCSSAAQAARRAAIASCEIVKELLSQVEALAAPFRAVRAHSFERAAADERAFKWEDKE